MSAFKQRDDTDCGAACFAFVAAHHGLHLPIASIRLQLGTGPGGTTAAAMIEAARGMGFIAKGVRGPVESLGCVPLPAIAHCLNRRKLLHYVVLVDWSPTIARVMDPVNGRIEEWPSEEFKSVWTGVLILLAPGEGFQPADHTMPAWRRLWRVLQPHRSVITQAMLGAILTTILGLATAIYVQKIVDHVIPNGNRQLLHLLGFAMLGIIGFKLVLGVFQSLLSLRTAQRIDATLIMAYYQHLLRLPQPFFDGMRVGEITARIGDAVKVRNFLNHSLLSLLLNPLILVFSIGAMFLWSWKLAVLSLALLPAHALLFWLVNRLNQTFQRQLMERAADFDSQLVESLSAQSLVRSLQLESFVALRTEIRLVRLLRVAWKSALASLATGTTGLLIGQLYLVALLWIGAGLVLNASLTPGQLMSSYTVAGYLTAPLAALIAQNATAQEALIATDRLFEIMDLELERDQGTIEFQLQPSDRIRFQEVSLQHPGRQATLQSISLSIPAACICAVVGPSGSGKSTLLALLQRLYSPTTGRIFLGEVDLQYLRLASLRRNLAVVPQQTRLLAGTVLENLAPGESQPAMDRLLRLGRRLGSLEFIEDLPQGFHTHLTENGANLSGGQRQRLAVLRALYRQSPILLLDEPTTALDANAVQSLATLLVEEKSRGCTVIVSTHDPAIVAIADLTISLDVGRVITAGRRPPVEVLPQPNPGIRKNAEAVA